MRGRASRCRWVASVKSPSTNMELGRWGARPCSTDRTLINSPTSSDPASETPAVRLIGVHKAFGGVHALKDAALALYPGQVTALIGENGAGKSTVVKILTGVLAPDSGEIEI